MRYRVSMPEPHSHLFHVELRLEGAGDEVVLAMPLWTPGSYFVRDYARHLEGLTVHDGSGRALPWARLDKHRFRVEAGGAGELVARYRVYANELTVRTSHLDGTHGFFNGAALLLYAEGREGEAHRLEVEPPPGWRVATALRPAPGATDPFADGGGEGSWAFEARDYDELVDSPVEVGRHALATFHAGGKPHAIAVWGSGAVDLGRLTEDARCIVEHFGELFGGLPYQRYLFIVHLTAGGRGGLEHAASTTLLVKRTAFHPRDAYADTLALVAHEFFHVWNVKGLRPAALVPYHYGRESYTSLLWWFEGVTAYYDELTIARTGLGEARRYLRHLGEELTSVERTPGAGKMSLEEASYTAWIKYYRQDENSPNSAVSYYVKGELVALALDLTLRRAGHTLDALVNELYRRWGGAGMPEDGVERALSERLGAEAARSFLDAYVRGTGPLELDGLLGDIGLRLRRRPSQGWDDKGGTAGKPDPSSGASNGGQRAPGWLGVALAPGAKLSVASVREESPAWKAGLYADDEIVAAEGFRADRPGLAERLAERGAGATLRLTVFRRDELVEVPVTLGAPPEDALWLEPLEAPTKAQRAAFRGWCGQELPGRADEGR